MSGLPLKTLQVGSVTYRIAVRPTLDGLPAAILDTTIFVADTGSDELNRAIAYAAAQAHLARRTA